MTRPLRALLLIAALAPAAPAAPARAAELDPYLSRLAAFGFSGQVVVADKGRVVLDRAFGFADKGRLAPVLPDTAFNVASFTKQFTAAAVLRLEADGKLAVGDAIGKYLGAVPEDKAGITLHQLLTHTAGLGRDAIRGADARALSRDETVRLILAAPLRTKPGERFAYSNDGYRLLAAIVERASNQPFRDYLADRVFGPAGMLETSTYDDPRWARARVASGYDEWHSLGSFRDWTPSWHRLGPGGVVSTARDLYRWMVALRGDRVLPAAQREKLFAAHVATGEGTSYGYGWFVGETADKRPVVFHGGDNPGYHSEVRFYPQDDRLVVVLTNRDRLGVDGGAVEKRAVADAIVRILSGDAPDGPPATVRLAAADLKRLEGEYRFEDGSRVRLWVDGGGLAAGAEGQSAVDRLYGLEPDAARDGANRKTLAIVRAAAAGKADDAKPLLSSDEFGLYVPFLAGEIRASGEKLGAVRDVRVLGTAPLPWDAGQTRTYAVVAFERGSLDLFLGWNRGALEDVTTGEGRPFPAILPVAAASRTQLVAYDAIRSRAVRVAVEAGGAALTIGGAHAERR